MCTAVTYRTTDFYFGRTLDNECSYGESVVITPRRFPFAFRHAASQEQHYALIGMAHMADGYPLYYDAVNEKGLGMAGLRFAGNAVYHACAADRDNVASFECIPWILGQCATVAEARVLLDRICVTDTPFSAALPSSPLHWLIADRREAITVESMADGLHIHDNPVGVLTNNPPFAEQLFRLNDYQHLSPKDPINTFSDAITLRSYSRGMGALGLPGDLSSASRFVRAAFVKLNSVSGASEADSVGQFFHILGSVEQVRGCCEVGEAYEITVYTSCCNADKGIYYYTTYGNRRITAVELHREDLDGMVPIAYPLIDGEQIAYQNNK
ncbi:MAG: choloylglycine hydrolase [Clostridia bacterium]|nr:choloylglycine hydrolase [Clostridia bacterium]